MAAQSNPAPAPAPQKTAGEVALRNVETSGMGTLQGFLEVYKGQIQMALADPKTMTADRMIRIAMSSIGRQPMLKKCTMASIAACLVQSSFLGLEPDGLGEAYLIPFWNSKLQVADRKGGYECQLQVGYLGLVKLARNTREFSVIDAQAVHENDEFEFEKGSETWWRHKWAKTGPRGKVIGYWAGWALKDGGKQFEYWTVEQIEAHRDRYSQAAWKSEWNPQTKRKEIVIDKETGKPILQGPWADSPDWMYKKTPLKQVSSWRLNPGSCRRPYPFPNMPTPIFPKSFPSRFRLNCNRRHRKTRTCMRKNQNQRGHRMS